MNSETKAALERAAIRPPKIIASYADQMRAVRDRGVLAAALLESQAEVKQKSEVSDE